MVDEKNGGRRWSALLLQKNDAAQALAAHDDTKYDD
jgi:hypothetical protein